MPGATDHHVVEAYIEHVLGPTLRPGQVQIALLDCRVKLVDHARMDLQRWGEARSAARCCCARWNSCWQLAALRPIIAAISAYGYSKTSRSTKTARSVG